MGHVTSDTTLSDRKREVIAYREQRSERRPIETFSNQCNISRKICFAIVTLNMSGCRSTSTKIIYQNSIEHSSISMMMAHYR